MYRPNPTSRASFDKTISPEQLDQLIDAIIAGKYSWACVLLLRFLGYNPLHYVPYRTYNRLIKASCQASSVDRHQTNSENTDNQDFKPYNLSSQRYLDKITDLTYLEAIENQHASVKGRGSNQVHSLSEQFAKSSPTKGKLSLFNKILSILNW